MGKKIIECVYKTTKGEMLKNRLHTKSFLNLKDNSKGMHTLSDQWPWPLLSKISHWLRNGWQPTSFTQGHKKTKATMGEACMELNKKET